MKTISNRSKKVMLEFKPIKLPNSLENFSEVRREIKLYGGMIKTVFRGHRDILQTGKLVIIAVVEINGTGIKQIFDATETGYKEFGEWLNDKKYRLASQLGSVE